MTSKAVRRRQHALVLCRAQSLGAAIKLTDMREITHYVCASGRGTLRRDRFDRCALIVARRCSNTARVRLRRVLSEVGDWLTVFGGQMSFGRVASLVIAIVAVLAIFVEIPIVSDYAFWFLVGACLSGKLFTARIPRSVSGCGRC